MRRETWRLWAAMLGVLSILPEVLGAQYSTARLTGVTFVEQLQSEIITQSGTSERRRSVTRSASFVVSARHDTLVITADTAHLVESADGVRQEIDVDAVIGARWTLLLAPRGKADVIDRPVVPHSIADVSDIGTAMEDFFPAAPPRLAPGGSSPDANGGRWARLADSSGVERYHYTGTHRAQKRTEQEGIAVESSEVASEILDLAWDQQRGPMAWTRNILTTATTRFTGRTVRARVEQRIRVSRH